MCLTFSTTPPTHTPNIKRLVDLTVVNSPLERFGIGSSTTGDVGTFAIDNVLVMPGATFERDIEVGPPPVLGDVDGSGIVDFADFEPIRAGSG